MASRRGALWPKVARRWAIFLYVSVSMILTAGVLIELPVLKGLALYRGWTPLAGHIHGHRNDLPTSALACVNCHDRGESTTGSKGATADISLNETSLTEMRVRRNGPPSAYDRVSFCKVLTSGVDPAFILVDRTMPRFKFSSTECDDLWAFIGVR